MSDSWRFSKKKKKIGNKRKKERKKDVSSWDQSAETKPTGRPGQFHAEPWQRSANNFQPPLPGNQTYASRLIRLERFRRGGSYGQDFEVRGVAWVACVQDLNTTYIAHLSMALVFPICLSASLLYGLDWMFWERPPSNVYAFVESLFGGPEPLATPACLHIAALCRS